MRNRTIYRCKLCGGRAWVHESYENHGNHGIECVIDTYCENHCEELEDFDIEEE
jgi:hypothetical protein